MQKIGVDEDTQKALMAKFAVIAEYIPTSFVGQVYTNTIDSDGAAQLQEAELLRERDTNEMDTKKVTEVVLRFVLPQLKKVKDQIRKANILDEERFKLFETSLSAT